MEITLQPCTATACTPTIYVCQYLNLQHYMYYNSLSRQPYVVCLLYTRISSANTCAWRNLSNTIPIKRVVTFQAMLELSVKVVHVCACLFFVSLLNNTFLIPLNTTTALSHFTRLCYFKYTIYQLHCFAWKVNLYFIVIHLSYLDILYSSCWYEFGWLWPDITELPVPSLTQVLGRCLI